MALSWLTVEETNPGDTGRRGNRVLFLLAGMMLVTVLLAVGILLIPDSSASKDRGEVRSVVASPDGRLTATVYSIHPALSFSEKTEVTLRLAAEPNHGEVSLGCLHTDEEDGSRPVEVRFEPADALTIEFGGETQTIRFDPQTLRPSEPIGQC